MTGTQGKNKSRINGKNRKKRWNGELKQTNKNTKLNYKIFNENN